MSERLDILVWLEKRLALAVVVEFFDHFGGERVPKASRELRDEERERCLMMAVESAMRHNGHLVQSEADHIGAVCGVSPSLVRLLFLQGRRDATLRVMAGNLEPWKPRAES